MLFDTSVRKELSRTFIATLVVILTIVLTMMLIRTLGQAARGNFAPADVVLALGYLSLGQLSLMLALSLFVAIVIVVGRMYRDSEMAIWFASGIPLSRFVRPVLRTGWPVLFLIAVLVLVVWPWSNQQLTELRTRFEQRSDLLRVSPGAFQSSNDGSKVFFVEKASDQSGARNVFLMDRHEDREAVTTARAGRLTSTPGGSVLQLEQGQRNEQRLSDGGLTRMSFERFAMQVDLDRAANVDAPPPKALATLELIRLGTPAHLGELGWRAGVVLASANMLLLALASAATNPRRASNWNLLFALLGFVVYYNLVNLGQAWVSSQKMGMGQAMLAIHLPALALALGLIWWRDHAITFSWRRPQRSQGAKP